MDCNMAEMMRHLWMVPMLMMVVTMTAMETMMVVIVIFMITVVIDDGDRGDYDIGDNFSADDIANDNDIIVMMLVTSDD